MERLLNDLVSDIVNNQSPSAETYKREWNAREQKLVAQKTIYMNNHEIPRTNRTTILNEYLGTNKKLRDAYMNATLSDESEKLHEWLRHVSNIPEALNIKPSSIYTFYS